MTPSASRKASEPDYAELERLALAAKSTWNGDDWFDAESLPYARWEQADADYVEVANPSTILSLLTELRASKSREERMRGVLKRLLDHDERDAGCMPTDAHLDAQEEARQAIKDAEA